MRAAIIGFAFVTVLATSVQAQEAPIVVALPPRVVRLVPLRMHS